MSFVWKPPQAVLPPQSFVPTRHHFLHDDAAGAPGPTHTRPGPQSSDGVHVSLTAWVPPAVWQSVLPSLSTRHAAVPAAIVPPHAFGSRRSHFTMQMSMFGTVAPPVIFTSMQL